MGYTTEYTEKLYVQPCVTCGIMFGVSSGWDDERRKDHKPFYCPNGHNQWYTAETDVEKLRKQLAERDRILQVRNTQLDDARKEQERLERSNRAVKAHSKAVKARVSAGVCPAGCHRHFQNLQRHIATKHPTYKGDEA